MTPAERKTIQAIQAYLVAHRTKIGYRMLRPMVTAHVATMAQLEALTAKGFEMDCSESVTLVCHVAGVTDPSGLGYDGYGNTETMLNHLGHHYTDAKLALPGALVVFNANLMLAEQHVAACHEKDPLHGNPVLFSHGTAEGPGFDTLANLQSGFAAETVWLSVAHL